MFSRIFKMIRFILFWLLFLLVLWLYSQTAKPPQPPSEALEVPPPRALLSPDVLADQVLVDKSERKLRLMHQDALLAEFDIALGFAPNGHKTRQGDGRTPVGEYKLDWRNANSSFYRSIHISYPSATELSKARSEGRDPGGDIMIHGQPNGSPFEGFKKIKEDWTNGCIAVSNAEMDEIWARVEDGTPITIIE